MAAKKYVLLVDHNLPFANAFRDLFVKKHPTADLEIVDNAKGALKRLALRPCDLIVADLRLPEVDGLQLLLRLRQSHPTLTKVVMAAHASPRDSQKAKEYGSVLYVEKPATQSDYDVAVGKIAQILANTSDIDRGGIAELKLEETIPEGDNPAKDCILTIFGAENAGSVFVEAGRILHAETLDKRGSDALKEIMTWEGGLFERRPFHEPVRRTLDMPWQDVAMLWINQNKKQKGAGASAAKVPVPKEKEGSSPSKGRLPALRGPSAQNEIVQNEFARNELPTTAPAATKPKGKSSARTPVAPVEPAESVTPAVETLDAPPGAARISGDSDQVMPAPQGDVTARLKPAPAEVAMSPFDLPLNDDFLKKTGLQFALQIDTKGKVQQHAQCPDVKLLTGVATFTAAKARELAQLFQWNVPLSVHFALGPHEMATMILPDKTILLGWVAGQAGVIDAINLAFQRDVLDQPIATKPRLAGTIDAMKKMPGLHGYAIFNKDHQILVKKFSNEWGFDLLQGTSRIVTQLCMVLSLQKLAVKLAQVKFDTGSIFAIQAGDLLLLVICHTQAKVPLLKDCLLRITTNEINKAVL